MISSLCKLQWAFLGQLALIVRDRFKGFGPVRYARLVKDQVNNRSRGTGFVCLYREDDAKALLSLSDEVSRETAPGQTSAVRLSIYSNP